MLERVILHCDLNNFFASVSLLSNATLKDCPVAVCGDPEKRHGIVLAKNDIAKAQGVKTAEAIWEAKMKCPDLIILPPDYEKYKEYSVRAHKIYEKYTDLIEPFGIDECWLDVTGSTMLFGTGEEIAEKIRSDIRNQLGITASVGVSFNKIFAKLGSDIKKPDATTVISRENFKRLVWPLPASDMLFIGKQTAEKLKQFGVISIGDLTLLGDDMLKKAFGKNGLFLKKYAFGLDDTPVVTPKNDSLPKSIGKSITPKTDIKNKSELWKYLLTLSESVAEELRHKKLFAYTVTLHIRGTDLKSKEIAKTVTVPINSALALAKCGLKIFEESSFARLPLRSVGIRASSFKYGNAVFQTDLFGENIFDERQEFLENSIDKVRDRFGKDILKRGTTLERQDKNDE